MKHDGSQAMTGNLNLGNNKVVNVDTPTSNADATNKKYVDAHVNALVKLDGSKSMTGNLDMNLKKVINFKDPVNSSNAATKSYVDLKNTLKAFSETKNFKRKIDMCRFAFTSYEKH